MSGSFVNASRGDRLLADGYIYLSCSELMHHILWKGFEQFGYSQSFITGGSGLVGGQFNVAKWSPGICGQMVRQSWGSNERTNDFPKITAKRFARSYAKYQTI